MRESPDTLHCFIVTHDHILLHLQFGRKVARLLCPVVQYVTVSWHCFVLQVAPDDVWHCPLLESRGILQWNPSKQSQWKPCMCICIFEGLVMIFIAVMWCILMELDNDALHTLSVAFSNIIFQGWDVLNEPLQVGKCMVFPPQNPLTLSHSTHPLPVSPHCYIEGPTWGRAPTHCIVSLSHRTTYCKCTPYVQSWEAGC